MAADFTGAIVACVVVGTVATVDEATVGVCCASGVGGVVGGTTAGDGDSTAVGSAGVVGVVGGEIGDCSVGVATGDGESIAVGVGVVVGGVEAFLTSSTFCLSVAIILIASARPMNCFPFVSFKDYNLDTTEAEIRFVKQPKKTVAIRLAPEDIKAVERIAERMGLSYTSLLRMWIKEHLAKDVA